MQFSEVVPAVFRKPLWRFKQFVWRNIDELVLERDLTSYKMSAMVESITVDVKEYENPLAKIVEIDPEFGDTARRFLNCGFRAFVCYSAGIPTGYIWLHDMSVTEQHPVLDRLGLRLRQGDIYLFNLYVAPEFRKGGVAGAFFAQTLNQLRSDGFKRAYGFVDNSNIPARWMYAAHGWQPSDRFSGAVVCNAILFSRRGVFYNSSLFGRRRVVQEFLPVVSEVRSAPPNP